MYKPWSRNLVVTLIVLICSTFLILIWEKAPLLASFIPLQARFDMGYPEILNRIPPLHHEKHGHPLLDSNSVENRTIDVTDKPLRDAVVDATQNHPQPTSKRCNYSKGRWVADKKRPLYSGLGCRRWLSIMWACRATARLDFSFENYRWQPEGCDMPEFQGSAFLKRMQDKTIALVGDSLGRQQFQSLMCMATGGEEEHSQVEDVGREYGLVKAPGAVRPDGWAYRFTETNTTILFYWSASLCELEPLNASDPLTGYAMHLDRPVAFLKDQLPRFDVLVLNTGHHWNRGKFEANRWEIYVGGRPDSVGMQDARSFAIRRLAQWLDSRLPGLPGERKRAAFFFRTMSPRHFVGGDWNTGGRCDNTVPLAGGSAVERDGSGDPNAEDAMRGTAVRLLDITAMSELRDEAHMSKYSLPGKVQSGEDCLHWCLPGVPDTWNEVLVAELQQLYEVLKKTQMPRSVPTSVPIADLETGLSHLALGLC